MKHTLTEADARSLEICIASANSRFREGPSVLGVNQEAIERILQTGQGDSGSDDRGSHDLTPNKNEAGSMA